MIISASRRTDIPAFFGKWFMNRLREGCVCVRNPFNYHQVSKVCLSPEVVDCIVLWTKNPENFLQYLDALDELGYAYYFQFTLNAYGQGIEEQVPDVDKLIETFRTLSERVGKARVVWRYDPIMLSSTISPAWHGEHYTSLAEKLRGYTERCVISFLDTYAKTKRNTRHLHLSSITEKDMRVIGQMIGQAAKENGIQVSSCCEAIDLSMYGITHGKCIDDNLVERITGVPIKARKDKNQRKGCGCVESIDVGSYNTCSHGCAYCYANYNRNLVEQTRTRHDPSSPLLIGDIEPEDKITVRHMKSLQDRQVHIFEE